MSMQKRETNDNREMGRTHLFFAETSGANFTGSATATVDVVQNGLVKTKLETGLVEHLALV